MKKLFATFVLVAALCSQSMAQQTSCDPGNTTGPPCAGGGGTTSSSTSVSTVTTAIILAILLPR